MSFEIVSDLIFMSPTGWNSIVGAALATGLTVRGSNPGGGKRFSLFHTWVPSSLLYNGYRGSAGGKATVV
jgi:hypothetical protein